MESQSVRPNMKIPQSDSPCYQKIAEMGFWPNAKDHFEKFVNAPMNQHRICLKKTVRGVTDKIKKSGSMFVRSNIVEEDDPGAKESETSAQVQSSGAK